MTTELARHLTVGCLETLALGQTPTWERYRQRPDDPTPTYDETCAVLNADLERLDNEWYWALEDAAELRAATEKMQNPRMTTGPIHTGLARIPIPARPLSYAVSRRTDPATSREAAASVIDPSKGTYARILTLFRKARDVGATGMTDEELSEEWAMAQGRHGWPPISPSGLRSRRNELTRRGLIVDSGERAKTRAGRRSIVWRLP